MEFKKYSSIENTYRKAEIDYIRQNAFDRGDFIIEEKVHGSNFAFYYDGTEIKCAKRTQFIDDMRAQGVNCVFHYVPLHNSPYGRKVARIHGDMGVTEELADRLVRLPLWLGIENFLFSKIFPVCTNWQ